MNYNPDRRLTYKGKELVPVQIVGVPPTSELDEFEPQRVKVNSNNLGLLGCDSRNRTFGNNWTFNVEFKQFTRGIKRVALNYAQFVDTVPNVNTRNNTIRWFDNGDATFKTATLPIGFYTFTDVAPALQTALNASVPAPSGAFTVTADPLTRRLVIDYPPGFYFDSNSDFIKYGKFCCGFQEDELASAQKISEISQMRYTNYYVIECPELTRYEKNVSTASDSQFSSIMGYISAYYLNGNVSGTVAGPEQVTAYYINNQWHHFFESTQITGLKIRIRDMYGFDPADIALGDPGWEVEFITEI